MGDIELLSGLKKALLKTVKIPSEEAGKKQWKKVTSTRNIKLHSHNIFGSSMHFP